MVIKSRQFACVFNSRRWLTESNVFEVIKEKQNLKSIDICLLNGVEQELSVLPKVGVKVMKNIICLVAVFGIACLGVFSRKYHCNMNISFFGF